MSGMGHREVSSAVAVEGIAFEDVAERIHALFSGGMVPEEMAEEIRASYEELSEGTPREITKREMKE